MLLACFAADGPVSYSRNKNHYSIPKRYQIRLFTHANVTGAVDRLAERGLIASHRMPPCSWGHQSWMELTTDSRSHIAMIICGPLTPNRECETILLRDAEGRLCDYQNTPELRMMRRTLEGLNESILSCTITGCRPCPLHRVFNRMFSRGGRFYTGNSWQNLPKGQRALMTMDGENVVEIDYKELHPSLLYAEARLRIPGNCYDIGQWPRALAKQATLILLNAKTVHSARQAIAQGDKISEVAEVGSKDAYQRAGWLISDIKTRHAPIAHAFHTDQGARLMRKDSELSETIMTRLNAKGIVVLPVHDSYLVKRSHADALEEAMLFAGAKFGFPGLQTERKS